MIKCNKCTKLKSVYILIKYYRNKTQILNKVKKPPFRMTNFIKDKIIHIEPEYNLL